MINIPFDLAVTVGKVAVQDRVSGCQKWFFIVDSRMKLVHVTRPTRGIVGAQTASQLSFWPPKTHPSVPVVSTAIHIHIVSYCWTVFFVNNMEVSLCWVVNVQRVHPLKRCTANRAHKHTYAVPKMWRACALVSSMMILDSGNN
jgi:hypothetical protein